MRIGPALLALLLAIPLATAHIPHQRTSIQFSEPPRIVEIELRGTRAEINLTQSTDPLRNAVRHMVDPAQGLVLVEHRQNPPDVDARFESSWTLGRIVEYRDVNSNDRFESGADVVVRTWRPESYSWNVSKILDATIGSVDVKTMSWTGRLAGAPNITIDLVAAGRAVVDEGASARSQDILLYFTITGFPPRTLGGLYAVDTTLAVRGPHEITPERVDSVMTNVMIDAGGRRGFLDWGGAALLDNREVNITARVGEPSDAGARTLTLDFPVFQRSMRLVVVSAVEYPNASPTPASGVAQVTLALAVCAFAISARAHLSRRAR